MDRKEFESLVGKDVLVDYPFHGEAQVWNMKNFIKTPDGIKHNRLPLIMDNFIRNVSGISEKTEATHG